jgi:hypothetical protein
MQLRFGPGVTPLKAILPLQMLVEMFHVPAHVMGPILTKHPSNLVDRHPLDRRLAKTPIHQPGQPILFVTLVVAPELPFRATQYLASLLCR